MSDLQTQVHALIAEACRHPVGSPQRQRCLTQIIRLVSGQLWKENVPYYHDALQQTWIYFCQNLCEAKTGRAYDADRGNVITWLNSYLKRRLQDGFIEEQQKRKTTVEPFKDADAKPVDPVDVLPAAPDIPPLLEEVKAWAESASDPKLRTIYVANHPHITCQLLILRRLPPETPWKDLAAELGISVATLSSFYQRQCLPLLREFGQSQGYL